MLLCWYYQLSLARRKKRPNCTLVFGLIKWKCCVLHGTIRRHGKFLRLLYVCNIKLWSVLLVLVTPTPLIKLYTAIYHKLGHGIKVIKKSKRLLIITHQRILFLLILKQLNPLRPCLFYSCHISFKSIIKFSRTEQKTISHFISHLLH